MAEHNMETRSTSGRFVRWFGVTSRPELVLFIALLVLAVFTRFYHLGDRVMSHDESLHTYYAYQYRQGTQGAAIPNPLMHGPLQFHLIAATFFALGDSDMTARIPVALAGVAGILLVFCLRRWLGKAGAWFTAALMLASPFLLYYSRYVRNEGLIVPLTILMFLAVFKYYETSESEWLYLFVATLALHFTAKETAFLYTAALLLFLGVMFLVKVFRSDWRSPRLRPLLAAGVIITLASLAAVAVLIYQELYVAPGYFEGGQVTQDRISYGLSVWFGLGGGLLGLVLMVAALGSGLGKKRLSEYPSLDLLVVTITMILPLFAALFQPDAMNYQNPHILRIVLFSRTIEFPLVILTVGILMLGSLVMGVLWD
jgi:4-amino-4-deoxy-L-arabinose transferase-like glycosyltransferase